MKFLSLRWKISGILIISNLILGILLVVLVNRSVSEKLGKELIERGRTIGANLAQYSAEQIIEEDSIGLRQTITESMTFESVEYILIQKNDTSILADTYNGDIPRELLSVALPEEGKRVVPNLVEIKEKGIACYDIWVPVEEGFLGYIRVGMKQDYVLNAVSEATKVIVFSIVALTLIGIILVLILANRIINPIIYLTKRADEISQGKLEEQVMVKTGDEIEKLGKALERLRESVRIALDRLEKHQTMRM